MNFVRSDSWREVVWSFGESKNRFYLRVCSRLLKKAVKRCTNFCNLILTSMSRVKTRSEKLLHRLSFAVASSKIYKTTLLLPTPMAVSHVYASIAQQVHSWFVLRSIGMHTKNQPHIKWGPPFRDALPVTVVTTLTTSL